MGLMDGDGNDMMGPWDYLETQERRQIILLECHRMGLEEKVPHVIGSILDTCQDKIPDKKNLK